MRVFLTGATGFIGSAVVPELLHAGHTVLGLTRSESGAATLAATGADVLHATIDDLDVLAAAAANCDAVIHTAFNHDFSDFRASCEQDRRAIEALGNALHGSSRPLIVTSGLALLSQGRLATENDDPIPPNDHLPRVSELTASALAQRGIATATVRLPQVHDTAKQGIGTYLVELARRTGLSAYIGEGSNRWAAVHRFDAARLYRLALEKFETGARYHAIAEEGVPLKAIAEAIGQRLNIPVKSLSQQEAPAHFGWLTAFAGFDLTGSSALTQQRLDWYPTETTLLDDLAHLAD